MLLQDLASGARSIEAAQAAFAAMEVMYPICRSITGDGVRRTLDIIGETLPLQRLEVPSGTPVFDWEVPREWNIRDAYIAGPDGARVVDFKAHNLHVVNYSVPVRARMSRDELEPHLHSLPDRPDSIPYRTTYWREQWGFCLRHSDRVNLGPGPYDVVIDSSLAPGSLSYAECVVPGSDAGEALVYTHTCHPSLANDNLTGIVVAAQLARLLREERPRLTWRFIFGPGTIGSLTWLARNEHRLAGVRGGLTLGLLGDTSPLTYKCSRLGQTVTDRVATFVLERSGRPHRVVDFEPYGYDERQFCSPGFDLPVGRLSRAQHGDYPQYHTSDDDLSIVSADRLGESMSIAAAWIATFDANRSLVNLCAKGEPRLGKRGLYGAVGGQAPGDSERAMLWVLSYSDGDHDLVDIAQRSNLPFASIVAAAQALEQAGLVRDAGASLIHQGDMP